LIAAGVNVFRRNLSPGEQAVHRRTYDRMRAAARSAGRTVGVLADLAGLKIRVGRFRNGGFELVEGARVTASPSPGASRRAFSRPGVAQPALRVAEAPRYGAPPALG